MAPGIERATLRLESFYEQYLAACRDAIAPLRLLQLAALLEALVELNNGELGALIDGTNTVPQVAAGLPA